MIREKEIDTSNFKYEEVMTYISDAPTKRQLDTLIAINKLINEMPYPPTVRELMVEMNYSSTSTMHNMLVRLKRKHLVDFIKGYPRTLVITPDGETILDSLEEYHE